MRTAVAVQTDQHQEQPDCEHDFDRTQAGVGKSLGDGLGEAHLSEPHSWEPWPRSWPRRLEVSTPSVASAESGALTSSLARRATAPERMLRGERRNLVCERFGQIKGGFEDYFWKIVCSRNRASFEKKVFFRCAGGHRTLEFDCLRCV